MRSCARAWLLACALVLPAWAQTANAQQVLTLEHAQLLAQVDTQPLPAQTISLPLHWDIVHRGKSGSAELRLRFAMPEGAAASREPHAVAITRIGNAFEIELNGVLLGSAGSLLGARDRWSAKYPVFLTFPSQLLARDNELRVRLRADAGYRSGLSVVRVGPAAQLAPQARAAALGRIALPLATAVLSLLVAAFCALLWWQQRDALYAWAGIGEALWALSVADTVIETSPLPWPYWGMSLLLLRALWSWSLYCIAQEVCGARPRLERRTMLAVQALMPLCIAAMVVLQSTQPLLLWYVLNFVTWIWVITRLATQAWRTRARVGGRERWIIVGALLAVMVASLRDVYAGRWSAELYDESAWAKYVATLVGAAMMWLVSRRFLSARAEVVQLNASLTGQVAQKEVELRQSFAKLTELERSRAVLAERERILRDLHDGVGANLATAVRQLEGGRASTQDVVQTLRESMDQLKLSIDAMNLPAGDVNALLASLRYRLQPRIESAGIAVDWQVDALPHWSAGNDEAMRHLQFLLLEVISNVLQHAQASTLQLSARASPGGGGAIEVSLTDNGCGLRAPPEQGLRSIHQRADAIGAVLTIEPAAPGTRVAILLAPDADR